VDKWGRKFGFVKFKEVKGVEELSKKLEDVRWEKYKLRINRARFGKGDKKESDTSDKNHPHRLLLGRDTLVSDDVSFKSLLLGKDGAGAGGVQVDKADMLGNGDGGKKKYRVASIGDIAPLEIHVHEATMIVLKQSMVGFFKNNMDYQTFNDRLLLEGQHEVKATFIGGNMVLLQCYCEGELAEVLKFNKQWWNHCFSKIIPWKPNLVSECREIWIDVYGIPLHAWEEGTFKMVAGRFGVFLDFDAATVSKQRLDVARVKLRTVRRGMIDTVVQLKVQGVAYDVWVVAERCRCVEERWYAKEEGDRSVDKTNNNSGEGV
jgi:hypothetical protein